MARLAFLLENRRDVLGERDRLGGIGRRRRKRRHEEGTEGQRRRNTQHHGLLSSLSTVLFVSAHYTDMKDRYACLCLSIFRLKNGVAFAYCSPCMLKHASVATTRTVGPRRRGADRGGFLLVAAGSRHQPGDRPRLPHRAVARRRRIRAGLPRPANRPLRGRPRHGLHQGQQPHRRLAARGLLRPAAGCASTRDSRLRHLSADARRRARPLLPHARVRAARRSERVPVAHDERVDRSRGAPRDRRHPRGAGQAASRPDAPPRSHAAERVRLRRTPPQARRLRHRPAAERPARHHRAHDERPDGAERHPRGRRAALAGARRCVSGRTTAGHADQRRRAACACACPRSAGSRAPIT